MKKIFFSFVLSFLAIELSAQIITVNPPFPTANDTIEIIYDASQGSSNLSGVNQVMMHGGVITSGPTGTAWQHVVGQWGNPNSPGAMTPLGNDRWSIQLAPYDYFSAAGLQPSTKIYRLGMVFREAGPCGGFGGASAPCKEGKDATGGDFFVDLSEPGFSAGITAPSARPLFFTANENVSVTAQSSESADLKIYVNDSLIGMQNSVLSATFTFNTSGFGVGKHYIVLEADNGNEVIFDSVPYIVRAANKIQNLPTGWEMGITYLSDTSVRLVTYAPFKNFIYVIGDFNNWEIDPKYRMYRDPSSPYYHLDINGLIPGIEYAFQYYIDEEGLRVADVYAEKYLDPWNDQWIPASTYPNLKPYPSGTIADNIVSIINTDPEEYDWKTTNYQRPPQTNLIVYELLVRDFVKNRSYAALIDSLDYLENLGVNAIQLMPVMEFEGNESWGYNPAFFFAPDKYYGPKNELKRFIDECHSRGIAVIFDIAINHSFGLNPQVRMYFNPAAGAFGQPTPQNPWFNEVAKHDFNVGYDYNHESPHTRAFAKRVFAHWVEEYKIDGYRLDLSKGFTQRNTLGNIGLWNQYDQSRVDILQDYANHVWASDPGVYMILEHLSDNDEERELANRGFMTWGIMHAQFKESALGYNNSQVNINWLSHQNRGYNNPHLVGYAVSHDEERLMYDCLLYGNSAPGYNVKDEATALKRMQAIHAILMAVPGPKMFWQFDEIGYDYSINHCPNGTVNPSCRTANKPLVWDYLDEPNRFELYEVAAAINTLKRDNPTFSTNNFNLDGAGIGKRVHLNHNDMDATICANFDVVSISMIPGFQSTGWWYDYISGDSILINDLNQAYTFEPGEFKIWTDKRLQKPDIPNPGDTSGGVIDFVNEFEIEKRWSVYPNPFTQNLQINLSAFDNIQSIEIYSIEGRLVKKLLQSNTANYPEVIYWNGSSDSGQQLPSGTYFLRAIDNGIPHTQKIMYLKN